jgi:hypothetical protein
MHPEDKNLSPLTSRETKQRQRGKIRHGVSATRQVSTDGVRQLAATRVSHAISTWMDALQMMRRLDTAFTDRFLDCRTAEDAGSLCNEWVGHRLDSLFAMEFQLIEIWLEYATQVRSSSRDSDQSKPASSSGDQMASPR